jgi:peptidoglycan/LPS O-acetylase OafA/YrhL
MGNKTTNPTPFFPNLDGWRFLCFLSVFFYHSFHTDNSAIKANEWYTFITREVFGNGNLGVNFFFVLSGFLITYLLFHEKQQTGRVAIPSFWMRRVLRIWPLFYFCVFFGFVLFPFIKTLFGQIPSETATPWMYLTFLNNFDLLANGLPDASVLGVLWSVAIEEQFYLIWPLLLAVVPFRYAWLVFTGIVGISIFSRVLNPTFLFSEYHTLSCIGDMAMGGFGAWAILRFAYVEKWITHLNKVFIVALYGVFIALYFMRDEWLMSNPYFVHIDRTIISVLILFVILEQNYAQNSFYKMQRFTHISRLGKYTYGMYCLHFIAILITLKITGMTGLNQSLWQVVFLETGLALLLTILIAKLSYTYFEQPFYA